MSNNGVTVTVPKSMHTDTLCINIAEDLPSPHSSALEILGDVDISGRDGRGGIGKYCIWEVIFFSTTQ